MVQGSQSGWWGAHSGGALLIQGPQWGVLTVPGVMVWVTVWVGEHSWFRGHNGGTHISGGHGVGGCTHGPGVTVWVGALKVKEHSYWGSTPGSWATMGG